MNHSSHRGRTSMKLAGTLRGDGLLVGEAGEAPVGYQLDVFETRGDRVGSGALDGDLSRFGEDPGPLVLRLADGVEVEVRVDQLDEDGATFSTRGPLPQG